MEVLKELNMNSIVTMECLERPFDVKNEDPPPPPPPKKKFVQKERRKALSQRREREKQQRREQTQQRPTKKARLDLDSEAATHLSGNNSHGNDGEQQDEYEENEEKGMEDSIDILPVLPLNEETRRRVVVRPVAPIRGHTSYLTFARKMVGPSN